MKYSALFPVVIIISLQVLLVPVEGATIHGAIYNWENLEPLPKAVVIINTTPEQRLVTEDGTYSFNLSPGNYQIKAYYYKEGKLKLYAEENVTIEREGEYVHDIILFPPLQISVEEPKVEFPTVESPDHTVEVAAVVITAGTAVLLLLLLFLIKKRTKKVKGLKEKKESEEELPDDLIEVIEILRKEEGRITQKELRKRLGYSEAKVSLIVADLERRGIVEKVKKGRGNIIFLREL